MILFPFVYHSIKTYGGLLTYTDVSISLTRFSIIVLQPVDHHLRISTVSRLMALLVLLLHIVYEKSIYKVIYLPALKRITFLFLLIRIFSLFLLLMQSLCKKLFFFLPHVTFIHFDGHFSSLSRVFYVFSVGK